MVDVSAQHQLGIRVKHLNPRQGITTASGRARYGAPEVSVRVKHLNPRQGITTRPVAARAAAVREEFV